MSDAPDGQAPAGQIIAGKITGCYGIKGWVKIHSYTDPVENIFGFGECQLQRRGALEAVKFDDCRRQGKGVVAHIAGVDDRNLAESFKGLTILVPTEGLPALEEGDFYWSQLQGLQVWCNDLGATDGPPVTNLPEAESVQQRVLLGTVDYLLETGANDVLVVKACAGSIDKKERLIPYLPDDVVTRVSLEESVIELDWFVHEE